MAYCKLYTTFAAIFNKLKLNNMKRVNYKLKKDQNCITIMLVLNDNPKTRNVSIIHSENVTIIDEIITN